MSPKKTIDVNPNTLISHVEHKDKRTGSPHEDALEERIATVEAAIHDAVYELYGLTEEEMRVVQSSQPS